MTISHVHCRVKDLFGAVEWFTSRCGVAPSFSDTRMAVFQFGALPLILDAASDDSVATIGFTTPDFNADCTALMACESWSRRKIAHMVHAPPICRGLAHSQSKSSSYSQGVDNTQEIHNEEIFIDHRCFIAFGYGFSRAGHSDS